MIPVEFVIDGQLGYRDRIQLLDLLFWRITSRAADEGHDLIERGLITQGAQREMAGYVGNAQRDLDRLREFDSFDFDEFDIERSLDRAGFPYRGRPYGFFYPLVPKLRSRAPVVEWITQQERLALAGAGLALAAAGYTPLIVDAIHTSNPISIKGNLVGVAAIIAALTAADASYHQRARADQMAQMCETVGEQYHAELKHTGVNPKKLQELGTTFRECLKSPVLSSTPMAVNIGEKE